MRYYTLEYNFAKLKSIYLDRAVEPCAMVYGVYAVRVRVCMQNSWENQAHNFIFGNLFNQKDSFDKNHILCACLIHAWKYENFGWKLLLYAYTHSTHSTHNIHTRILLLLFIYCVVEYANGVPLFWIFCIHIFLGDTPTPLLVRMNEQTKWKWNAMNGNAIHSGSATTIRRW